jgi:hypothetical protein
MKNCSQIGGLWGEKATQQAVGTNSELIGDVHKILWHEPKILSTVTNIVFIISGQPSPAACCSNAFDRHIHQTITYT